MRLNLENIRTSRWVRFRKDSSAGTLPQESIDILTHKDLEENPSYIRIGNKYLRFLFVTGYPYISSMGWMDLLVYFKHDLNASYYLDQINAADALANLNIKISELESKRKEAEFSDKIVSSQIYKALDSAINLRDKIHRGEEKLVQVSIYIGISADSFSELNSKTTLLQTFLSNHLFHIKTAMFQQLGGLDSLLPYGENVLSQKKNMSDTKAALIFPFISSELVQETGILYGVNKLRKSLVIVDRFSLNNPISLFFVKPGPDRSKISKLEILRQLIKGTKVIVIDSEGEYGQFANNMGGTLIRLSERSRKKINLFEHLGSTQVKDLIEIIVLMAGRDLSPEEKVAVREAFRKTLKIERPVFADFYKILKNMPQEKLCSSLVRYYTGPFKGIFNYETNISLSNRLVVFDIKEIPETLRLLQTAIITNFVKRKIKSGKKNSLLVIDDAGVLLENKRSGQDITDMVKSRTGLGVSLVSHKINNFIKNDNGLKIILQSSLKIYMCQYTVSIKQKIFNLSDFEKRFLLSGKKEEGLLFADGKHVIVKFVASEKEDRMVTNPAKKLLKKQK